MARKVSEKKAEKKPQSKVNHSVVSAVSPWFLSFNWDHMLVNDDWMRMLMVHSYPSALEPGWGEGFRGLDGVNAPVSVTLRSVDNATLRSQIARTVNEANLWSADDINSTVVEQMERQFEAEQSMDAADMLIRSKARIFETYVYVGVRAGSEAELDKRTEDAKAAVAQRELGCDEFKAAQQDMFLAASPFMCENSFMADRLATPMPSTTVAMGLFNQEAGLGDPSGVPLGHDGAGAEICIDPSLMGPTRMNRNTFIAAASGSGKSTLIRRLINYYRCVYDYDVIVNDVDDEYGDQVEALGGKSVHFNKSSAMLLDPFLPRNVDATEDVPKDGERDDVRAARREAGEARVLSSHLPFLTTFLRMAFNIGDGDIGEVLRDALTQAYNEIGVTNEMTFAEYERSGIGRPSLRSLYEVICRRIEEGGAQQAELASLELKLRHDAVGYNKHLWESTGKGMPDARLVRINLQSFSDSPAMLAAQYYNIFTWEWSQIRSNRYTDRTVVLVFDEVHKVVNSSNIAAANMLRDMLQRVRKYGAFVVCSTQQISDMLDGDVAVAGTGIMNCSAIQFFGATGGSSKDDDGKSAGNLRAVKAYLEAEPAVVDKLAGAGRGEFLTRVGTDQRGWLHTYPPADWERALFGRGSGR